MTEHIAATLDETIGFASRFAQATGHDSFEIRFDGLDRVIPPDDSPEPGEPVRWTVTATRLDDTGLTTHTGTATTTEGHTHGVAVSYACIRFLEDLGARTIVVDATRLATEPPR